MILNKQNLIDKYIKDKSGRVVVAQKPNLPIVIWATAFILSQLFSGTIGKTMSVIAFGSIFTWAWLEIFMGVNYFRRALGLAVLILAVWHQIL